MRAACPTPAGKTNSLDSAGTAIERGDHDEHLPDCRDVVGRRRPCPGRGGAVLAFTFTGEVLGIDVDVAGWLLMAAGVVALVAAATRRLRR